MTTRVRVLLVDDQALLRSALATVLGADPRIDVVGEAGDGDEAVEAVRAHRVDVVLMDIRMPRLDGIRATERVVRLSPATRVLVLTTFDSDDLVMGALRAGASGFLTKDARPEALVAAICDVASGSSVLAPHVTTAVLEHVRKAPAMDPSALSTLSTREVEIFHLLAAGCSNAEIGQRLHLAYDTVKTHVRAVLAKLGLRDRVHAVIFAYEHGLVGRTHPPG
ncbi:response regulator transcription factor [Actinotalea sp. BY-33]|uniref:Response regulator transcription factor n=1 Tax=Actinotalea soli TaxID=2819234 RepID=A0A939RX50_9CELL|nr:response regulator transcription factor [Actinotalea soli]MBO1752846.1 response regulator transcription factor [Actinotalea soli]